MTWLSDTIVLHSSHSCAILVHSATDDPIQSLMSSVHRLLGRPRRFLPLIQPRRTAVHRLSALAVCPKKLQFPSLNVLQKSRFFSDFFENGLVCSVLFPADPQHASIWCHFGLPLQLIATSDISRILEYSTSSSTPYVSTKNPASNSPNVVIDLLNTYA